LLAKPGAQSGELNTGESRNRLAVKQHIAFDFALAFKHPGQPRQQSTFPRTVWPDEVNAAARRNICVKRLKTPFHTYLTTLQHPRSLPF
jgi:hypothetical protein